MIIFSMKTLICSARPECGRGISIISSHSWTSMLFNLTYHVIIKPHSGPSDHHLHFDEQVY